MEADHSHLKHRLCSMRGLRTDRTTQVITAGHAFMQNLRRGHYELRGILDGNREHRPQGRNPPSAKQSPARTANASGIRPVPAPVLPSTTSSPTIDHSPQ
ncbi:DDE-type integrase/transposase/recombinase [Plantactinospora sp. KLBMP9567]|uniref:DDE-type integrase/transposase/recombinase n=1 Tax=Plantactinospora sp. KLBMP9567 TaxID=3085900 RepID=UPI003990BF9B